MHVVYVIAPGGGPDANVKTLAPEFEKRGHRVTVIYTVSSDDVDTVWSRSVRFRFAPPGSIHYYVAKLVGSFRAWPLRIRAWEQARAVRRVLAEVEREERIDVVEVTEGFSVANLGSTWPIVVRAHGSDWTFRHFCHDGDASGDVFLKRAQGRQLLHSTSASALSEHLALHLQEALKVAAAIEVLPYGIDINTFSPNGYDRSSRPVLLTVGRLERRKGVDVLLRAMTRVWEKFPDVEVRLVGNEGDLKREHLLAVVPEDKQQQIVFPGFLSRDELVSEYQHATAYVAPTQYETFGYTVLEAMSCGRPVVSTRVGAIPELIEHGKNGLVVEWNDLEALADAIVKLLSDSALATYLGAAGRRTAIEHFSLDGVVERNLDCYRRAISSCTS